MFPSRPSRRAFVENSPSKARIFVILPVYMWFWAHSEGIHHWEPAWELLLTFRWSFERLNISIHLILWCPPWPALLKNKFCSILTFLANLDKKKKIKNVNLARLCARLKPVFLPKKGPSRARLLTKMSPSEELGTLYLYIYYNILQSLFAICIYIFAYLKNYINSLHQW